VRTEVLLMISGGRTKQMRSQQSYYGQADQRSSNRRKDFLSP
jgi:hypothetical protein